MKERVCLTKKMTDYPDLEELNVLFKPFYELTFIAFEFEYNYKDWTQSPLMKQEQIYSKINTSVDSVVVSLLQSLQKTK